MGICQSWEFGLADHCTDFVTIVSTVMKSSPRTCTCRWDWCRQFFLTYPELERHVIEEHVLKSIPVRRRDLPLLWRTEEGIGESLTLDGLVIPSQNKDHKFGMESQYSVNADLPLSPSSSQPIPPDQPSLKSPPSNQSPSSSPDLIPSQSHLESQSSSSVPFSFAAISSSSSLSYIFPENPIYPPVEDMLDQELAHRRKPRPALTEPVSKLITDSNSLSDSQNSVEKQLTQEAEMDVDYEKELDRSPSVPPAPSTSPDIVADRPECHKTVTAERDMINSSIPSAGRKLTLANTRFLTGVASSLDSSQTKGLSQNSSADDQLSSAPLQTQAPYCSQDPSQ